MVYLDAESVIKMDERKECDDCVSGVRKYCDGFPLRDFSGFYLGDPKDLPQPPDKNKYWTYQECKKNKKSIIYLNLDGACPGFEQKKTGKKNG